MTPKQRALVDAFFAEEVRPERTEPFFLGPETFDAFVALRAEVERLRGELAEAYLALRIMFARVNPKDAFGFTDQHRKILLRTQQAAEAAGGEE